MTGREIYRNIKFLIKIMDVILYPLFAILPYVSRVYHLLCVGWRFMYCRHFCSKCGDNIYIGKNVVFKGMHKLYLGSNVSFHDNCYIDAGGGIIIGNNVSIAHGTTIMSLNHSWDDSTKPIKYNRHIGKVVVIKDDVWIASGVKIMAGVTIESRCVIAAGAVVTHDCLQGGLYAGVPAKRVKNLL